MVRAITVAIVERGRSRPVARVVALWPFGARAIIALGPIVSLGPVVAGRARLAAAIVALLLWTIIALRAVVAILARWLRTRFTRTVVAIGITIGVARAILVDTVLADPFLAPVLVDTVLTGLIATVLIAAILRAVELVTVVAITLIAVETFGFGIVTLLARARIGFLVTRAAFGKHAKIMVGELEIIFRQHAVAGLLRIARERLVLFEKLRRVAPRATVDAVAHFGAATAPAAAAAATAILALAAPATSAAGLLSIVDQAVVVLANLEFATVPRQCPQSAAAPAAAGARRSRTRHRSGGKAASALLPDRPLW